MATIFVLFGSVLGFLAAILSFTVLDISLFAALGIWVLSGPLMAVFAVAMALRPAAIPHDRDPQAEIA